MFSEKFIKFVKLIKISFRCLTNNLAKIDSPLIHKLMQRKLKIYQKYKSSISKKSPAIKKIFMCLKITPQVSQEHAYIYF